MRFVESKRRLPVRWSVFKIWANDGVELYDAWATFEEASLTLIEIFFSNMFDSQLVFLISESSVEFPHVVFFISVKMFLIELSSVCIELSVESFCRDLDVDLSVGNLTADFNSFGDNDSQHEKAKSVVGTYNAPPFGRSSLIASILLIGWPISKPKHFK